jgi:hypothetical protein
MARLSKEGLSGVVGNLIFYNIKGVTYVRSKPNKRKKKRGYVMPANNAHFAVVVKNGGVIYKRLKVEWKLRPSRTVNSKVRGWMKKLYSMHADRAEWPLSSSMDWVNLFADTDIREYWKAGIDFSDTGAGKITISIPSMNPWLDIPAPVTLKKCNFHVMALATSFGNAYSSANIASKTIEITRNDQDLPEMNFDLELNSKPGEIVFIAVMLDQELRKERRLSAALVGMGRLK